MGDPVIDYGNNLTGNETLHVRGQDHRGRPCGETFQTTTSAIAALGGTGGIGTIIPIDSGTSVNAAFGTYYVWNSPVTAEKNMLAPPATGSGNIIKAIDQFGNAATYAVNFVPNGGDIVIANQNQLYTDGGSATWRDLRVGVWGLE